MPSFHLQSLNLAKHVDIPMMNTLERANAKSKDAVVKNSLTNLISLTISQSKQCSITHE